MAAPPARTRRGVRRAGSASPQPEGRRGRTGARSSLAAGRRAAPRGLCERGKFLAYGRDRASRSSPSAPAERDGAVRTSARNAGGPGCRDRRAPRRCCSEAAGGPHRARSRSLPAPPTPPRAVPPQPHAAPLHSYLRGAARCGAGCCRAPAAGHLLPRPRRLTSAAAAGGPRGHWRRPCGAGAGWVGRGGGGRGALTPARGRWGGGAAPRAVFVLAGSPGSAAASRRLPQPRAAAGGFARPGPAPHLPAPRGPAPLRAMCAGAAVPPRGRFLPGGALPAPL